MTEEQERLIRERNKVGTYDYAASDRSDLLVELDEWRRLATRVTSVAWSLSQWNDHNFTRDHLERWRKMTEERCKEVESAWLANSAIEVPTRVTERPRPRHGER